MAWIVDKQIYIISKNKENKVEALDVGIKVIFHK